MKLMSRAARDRANGRQSPKPKKAKAMTIWPHSMPIFTSLIRKLNLPITTLQKILHASHSPYARGIESADLTQHIHQKPLYEEYGQIVQVERYRRQCNASIVELMSIIREELEKRRA